MEVCRICCELLNQSIGGGVFAQLQVQPVIHKIINQLSIDCDRFFDKVADDNQIYLEEKAREDRKARYSKRKGPNLTGNEPDFDVIDEDEAFKMRGLSKSIFFKLLLQNGVMLNEYEKALMTTVFGMKN